ncbi:MAG: hypothetical protein WCK15_19855 [Pirellula sp.]
MTPRVHIEFSSGSSMAAIVRRGPSKWVRLLAWNTADDTITPGSWFHGRIYEDRCSVSPDGTLFAYFATKYEGPKSRDVDYAWTAISKLPWLTALALWPQSDTYGGRAKFVDNQTLIIDIPHWEPLTTNDKLPKGFSVLPRRFGKRALEQHLPPTPQSTASFDGSQGFDQNGRSFQYEAGRLVRKGRLIVDLGAMLPDPQRSPDVAYTW